MTRIRWLRWCYIFHTVSVGRPGLSLSERLEEGDQRLRVAIAEVGAEVMAAIDDVIRAFAQYKELLADVREYLARLIVGGARRQRLQVAHQLHHRLHHRLVVRQSLAQARCRRQRLEVGQQIDRRPGRDRSDFEPALIEELRS